MHYSWHSRLNCVCVRECAMCRHEWDGMQDFVAQMKEKEAAGEVDYPRGAGPNAVEDYIADVKACTHPYSHIPYTPKEADGK